MKTCKTPQFSTVNQRVAGSSPAGGAEKVNRIVGLFLFALSSPELSGRYPMQHLPNRLVPISQ